MTGPLPLMRVAIAASASTGEARISTAAAITMSSSRLTTRSTRSLRLLPGAGAALPHAVPEPGCDRCDHQHVVAGQPQWGKRQGRGQQGSPEQCALDDQCGRVDPSVSEQGNVGSQQDEMEQRREVAQQAVRGDLERVEGSV